MKKSRSRAHVRRYDQGGGVRPVDPSNVPIDPGPTPEIYQPQQQSSGLESLLKMGLSVAGMASGSGSSSSTSKARGGKVGRVVRPKTKRRR